VEEVAEKPIRLFESLAFPACGPRICPFSPLSVRRGRYLASQCHEPDRRPTVAVSPSPPYGRALQAAAAERGGRAQRPRHRLRPAGPFTTKKTARDESARQSRRNVRSPRLEPEKADRVATKTRFARARCRVSNLATPGCGTGSVRPPRGKPPGPCFSRSPTFAPVLVRLSRPTSAPLNLERSRRWPPRDPGQSVLPFLLERSCRTGLPAPGADGATS